MIGALLPSTQIEDELVGETSDAAKQRLRQMAGEEYEKAKDLAMHTAEAAIGGSGVTASSANQFWVISGTAKNNPTFAAGRRSMVRTCARNQSADTGWAGGAETSISTGLVWSLP